MSWVLLLFADKLALVTDRRWSSTDANDDKANSKLGESGYLGSSMEKKIHYSEREAADGQLEPCIIFENDQRKGAGTC